MKYILFMILFIGCANQVNVPQDVNVHQSGEVNGTVSITMGFLDQIKQICQDLYATVVFENDNIYRQTVAQCVIDRLSGLNVTPTINGNTITEVCDNPEVNTNLTPEQQAELAQFCSAMK